MDVLQLKFRMDFCVQDFYNWPDESFEEMDSTLAVQQVCCHVLSVCVFSDYDLICEQIGGKHDLHTGGVLLLLAVIVSTKCFFRYIIKETANYRVSSHLHIGIVIRIS